MNKRAAYCPKGHPFDDANTHWRTDNSRLCRKCAADRSRLRRQLLKLRQTEAITAQAGEPKLHDFANPPGTLARLKAAAIGTRHAIVDHIRQAGECRTADLKTVLGGRFACVGGDDALRNHLYVLERSGLIARDSSTSPMKWRLAQ